MGKYKILWLDDEFTDENGSVNLPLPLIRGRYPELDIVTVQYVDICEKELRNNSESYQAVIIDANGKFSYEPTLGPNKIGFEDNISIAKQNGLPIYVFSGQLEIKEKGDQADITIRNLDRAGFIKGENLFFKSDTYKILLDKVLSDLKNNFSVFYEYPQILENVIRFGINKKCVKELLLWMKDKTLPFPKYDDLRRIIYDEAIELRLKPFFGKEFPNIDPKHITEECMSNWEKSVIFWLLKNLLNAEVHNWPSDDINSKEIISHAFITIMNWYNRFMHKVQTNSNPNDYYILAKSNNEAKHKPTTDFTGPKKALQNTEPYEGVIEKDERNGLYHVGEYLLNPLWGMNNLGKRVRVIKESWLPYKKLAYKCEETKSIGTSDLADKLKEALDKH